MIEQSNGGVWMSNCAWVSSSQIKKTPWGREITVSNAAHVAAKLISIKKGEQTSFKYNKVKFESFACISGKLKVFYANSDFFDEPECTLKTSILVPGMTLNIQCCCPYRILAIEDSQLLEIGTHGNDDGIVRLIDNYNRKTVNEDYGEKLKRCIQDL